MKLYETSFYQQLSEDITVGSAMGGSPEAAGFGPYEIEYAGGRHGDNRLPMGGRKQTKKKKKNKNKHKDVGINLLIPTQRRPLGPGM